MEEKVPSTSESLEIPGDWVECVITGDIEFLNDLDITRGMAQYFGGPFGEARILRPELKDAAAFEAEVRRIASGTTEVFFRPHFLNQKEADEDHAKQPHVDAALEKKKAFFQGMIDTVRRRSES